MSWIDANIPRRAPIVVPVSSGSATQVKLDIPAVWPEFWDSVQSDRSDIRITLADGVTKVANWQATTWTYASKSGVIHIASLTPPVSSGAFILWIYWGAAGQTTSEGTVVPSAPIDGYVWPGGPDGVILSSSPNTPGSTSLEQLVAKTTTEELAAWFQMPQMAQREIPFGGSLAFEELESVSYTVDDVSTAQSGMVDSTKVRALSNAVRFWIKAGSTGEDYTINPVFTTTLGRKVNPRALLRVANPVNQ